MLTAQQFYDGFTFEYTETAYNGDCVLCIRPHEANIAWTLSASWDVSTISSINQWAGKNVVVWGDSITAKGNGDNDECVDSYMYRAFKELAFSNMYVRGIGSQMYTWNTNGYYSEVNTNGKYLDRYLYDENGNRLNIVIDAASYTQQQVANIEAAKGVTIEVHYGAFCSWDRIKSMIPSSIRETIDCILLVGGTNDFSTENIDTAFSEPQWSASNQTDTTWVNDATYYNGGDYDITTFAGAIASTIMKMKTWCPNAVIIVCTPFAHFNLTTKLQDVNGDGINFREMCELEMKIASYLSTPVIDSNGECGIQGYDYTSYVSDATHPNQAGRDMFGRPFVGGLLKNASKKV